MNAISPSRFSFAAIGLVAGIYVHFLLFAQFGFLQGIRAAGHSVESIHFVLGAMALSGIAASFLAAAALARTGPRIVAVAGLTCATTAGGVAALVFSHAGTQRSALVAIALFTGAGLGAATVAAAMLLRRFTGGRALGLHVGLGTGAAYLFCNIPAVFTATPADKGWISALAAIIALGATLAGRAHQPGEYTPPPLETRAPARVQPRERYPALTTRGAIAFATLAFLALVWFDSAAFTAVQNAPELRALFWDDPRILWTIGLVHALAAVAAGVLIDRGALRSMLACALALIVLGHLGFGRGAAAGAWAAPVYVAGVSLYSTALAAFAALGPVTTGVRPPWRAAWIYAIAGWVGSGSGVGLAEQFGRVPTWSAPAAALVLAGALSQLRSTR